jgi:hypothetical protein
MRIFLTLSLLMAVHSLFSQNVVDHTVQWSVSRMVEANTGALTDLNETIESYGSSRIEWKDRRGNIKQTFVIREVNGTWTDIQSPGNILFEVDCEGRLGTVRFSRQTEGIVVQVVLLKADDNPDIYELHVTDLTIL